MNDDDILKDEEGVEPDLLEPKKPVVVGDEEEVEDTEFDSEDLGLADDEET